ncbi:MAG: valine--tRNA ligase [Planctomycetes bacterium]|nr:valine--tRNA ligase [Planctomycetota bacterium]
MMTAQLPKSYSPAESEAQVRERWDNSGAFHAEPGPWQHRPEDGKPLRRRRTSLNPFCIVIPPPNVTAALHLGHAFNITLQDVLIRYHRMCGFNTLWMPGTDHAGIATQAVVEKRLLQQGTSRKSLGREEFVAKVQAWKDQYEATIIEQLKAMGCSCDWARTRFTMDEMCAKAVREAFFGLFKDGLIYRGKRLVNWDPVTQTALADDEVEMQEIDGHMWYLRYPLAEPASAGGVAVEYVTVATTRPETMLGDTAVAMNPKDPRAAAIVGKNVKLPIVDRIVPIITDEHVVMPDDRDNPMAEYATGFLKVTPAHDPNDWEIGQRHDLPVINVMAPDATISAEHGWTDVSDEAIPLLGLAREEARRRIVEWFKDHDLLEDVRDYRHSVGHSYRSHVPIEPYLSDQWYVKVTDDRLRGEALRALSDEQFEGTKPSPPTPLPRGEGRVGDGELTFFPARYAKTFQAWHENLRDWCISRQLWWGHRIPVWTYQLDSIELESKEKLSDDRFHMTFALSDRDGEAMQARDELEGAYPNEVCFTGYPMNYRYDDAFLKQLPGLSLNMKVCVRSDNKTIIERLEAAGFEQDPDVLDTWFSSALWPISTMGWPEPKEFPDTLGLLETFNPSSMLCTGRDIITLWVSRMVMFNRYFRDGTLPFRHVYIHPMIQDGHGQRMSKSLGNGVDPRDIIHSHGADAMRFVLVQMATSTQDVRMPVDLICPHCSATFHPDEITSPAGYHVAAPQQECPQCKKTMVSSYGAACGFATPSEQISVARNTSAKFDLGRNFANKLWNATRFAVGNLEASRHQGIKASRKDDDLTLADRWIITRLHRTLHAAEKAVRQYQFNVYAEAMYDLVWRDFCDWYLEAIKPTIKDNPAQQQVLRTVLNAILRMLHPICPFVTEALWPHVQAAGEADIDDIKLPPSELLAIAAWPKIACRVDDKEAAATFERVQALTDAIRTVRGEHNVQPRQRIRIHATPRAMALIKSGEGVVETLAGLESASLLDPSAPPADAIPLTFEGEQLRLSGLAEAVDPAAERVRLAKLVQHKEQAAAGFRKRLDNDSYVNKAPANLVDETRTRLAEAEADLAAARRDLEVLQGAGAVTEAEHPS